MLDDLDKELEQRGHRFVRYADDCNIYVASERAGERVMASVTAFLSKKLKLKVNEEEHGRPAVAAEVPGVQFLQAERDVLIRVATKALDRFRSQAPPPDEAHPAGKLEQVIQEINQYTMGWIGYFRLADAERV